mmetsp:Transcript_28119/g.80808  ORF Transcript_28119/g.80808 Transcript_28119/m.80808 type:complete len:327 (+) Transcript_28119:145-1125(+)
MLPARRGSLPLAPSSLCFSVAAPPSPASSCGHQPPGDPRRAGAEPDGVLAAKLEAKLKEVFEAHRSALEDAVFQRCDEMCARLDSLEASRLEAAWEREEILKGQRCLQDTWLQRSDAMCLRLDGLEAFRTSSEAVQAACQSKLDHLELGLHESGRLAQPPFATEMQHRFSAVEGLLEKLAAVIQGSRPQEEGSGSIPESTAVSGCGGSLGSSVGVDPPQTPQSPTTTTLDSCRSGEMMAVCSSIPSTSLTLYGDPAMNRYGPPMRMSSRVALPPRSVVQRSTSPPEVRLVQQPIRARRFSVCDPVRGCSPSREVRCESPMTSRSDA